MSFSKRLSAVIQGMQVEFVQVEADVSNGLPIFHMVGYLSSEVKEAGERVRTAIKNSGFEYPSKRTVINLSPATIKKRGASFDLPIAVSILTALGGVRESDKKCVIIGELGLDGSVRKVPGILPVVMEAKENNIRFCIVPYENAAEGRLIKGVEVIGVRSLAQAVQVLNGRWKETQINMDESRSENKTKTENIVPDFSDIRGQENVKRAAEIAVSGRHNLLLIGPPGSGKSMTAKCIPGILPAPDLEESLEITKIYSVMGMLDEKDPLIRTRPFREVHHTATRAALAGGGLVPHPGEISLAHGGVLFLDELPEFRKSVLEVLRQPLEERQINLSRASGNYCFPGEFILVGAMNPCPCGAFPDTEKCKCTPSQVSAYLGRISRPFLDRIDLCVETPKVKYESLVSEEKNETSSEVRKRVERVWEIQKERYRGTGIKCNSMLDTREIRKYCELGKDENKLMEQAFSVMGLTARTYHRIIKVARTIADLDGSRRICEKHLKEAIGYRMADEMYWRR